MEGEELEDVEGLAFQQLTGPRTDFRARRRPRVPGLVPSRTDRSQLRLVNEATEITTNPEKFFVPNRNSAIDQVDRFSFDRGDESSRDMTTNACGLGRSMALKRECARLSDLSSMVFDTYDKDSSSPSSVQVRMETLEDTPRCLVTLRIFCSAHVKLVLSSLRMG